MPPSHTEDHSPGDVAATFCATLVDEWVHHGVRHAVVAPGSRSTVMALALAGRDDIDVHIFHDERAAAFAALGVGMSGIPAVLLCTSGTAAANFHPAVIEAHLSAIPILVCTADRPPELRDVGAPQTIDQTKLYGDAVRWFHDPGVAAVEARGTWRGLAAHAFGSATGLWPGPVHLNLSFREPLVGRPSELPARLSSGPVNIASRARADEVALRDLSAVTAVGRGVIVAGRGCGSAEAIRDLSLTSGWPVLADARSGVRHLIDVAVSAADALLRSRRFAVANRPDVVLRLGEPPASKVLNEWLATSGARQIQVSPVPAWTDPDGVITTRLVAEPSSVCRALAASCRGGADAPWWRCWLDAEAVAQATISEWLTERELLDGALSEPLIARSLVANLTPGSNLVVSSSMPIRDLEWYGVVPAGVAVFANRGANGIDGVIATAIGIAISTGAPTTLLIGDVAFLHDGSALIGLLRRGVDLRIVIVDNDGGGIFSFLPQAAALSADTFEQLFGTPHGVELSMLAAAHGLATTLVTSAAALVEALAGEGPYVVVARTNRRSNVGIHDAVHAAVIEALDRSDGR